MHLKDEPFYYKNQTYRPNWLILDQWARIIKTWSELIKKNSINDNKVDQIGQIKPIMLLK